MEAPPKICVVIPAYNHEKFIAEAISSVDAQGLSNLELKILDDGSQDASPEVAEMALAACDFVRGTVTTQVNCGSANTLNRLIDSADADYIAILNSDDVYQSGRLKSFLEAANGRKLFFGFSGVLFQDSAMVSDYMLFEDWYRSKLAYACAMPTCGFAVLTANIAITSSNFFFSREVFDLAGGFDPSLTLTQDWQFVIKAIQWVEPLLLPERLLTYRVHENNTYRKLQDTRIEQSQRVLDAFVDWADERVSNPQAPIRQLWPKFFQYFARTCAPAFSTDPIGKFLPDSFLQLADNQEPKNPADQAAVLKLLATSRELHSQEMQSTGSYLKRAAQIWAANY